jgi:hypothetical protein
MSTTLKRLLLLALVTQITTACQITTTNDGGSEAGAEGGDQGGNGGGEGGATGGGEGGATGGGEGGATGGGEGGATGGGEGGATGGGEGGASAMTGSGTCDSPFSFVAQADGTFRATGALSDDDLQGSCSNPEATAEDVVLSFTAPEAGLYELSTADSFGLDSVLYVRTECADAASELSCNDDFGDFNVGEVQSKVTVDLTAGQTVFVVVDSFNTEEGAEGAEFVVTATKITANAPTLAAAEGAFDPNSYSIGFRVQGSDADADVTAIGFTLIGTQEVGPYEVEFGDLGEVTFSGDMFTGVVGGAGDETFVGATGAKVYVVDSRGLVSNEVEITFALPTYIEAGTPCSLTDGFNVCAQGTLCITEAESVDGTCTVAVPPSITTGAVYYNDTAKTLGFRVEGADATEGGPDIDFVRLSIRNAAGENMFDQDFDFPFEVVADGANFVATLSTAWPEDAEAPVTVVMTAVDLLGLQSEPFTATVSTEIPTAALGAACDDLEALSVCVDSVCANELCTAEAELVSACPMDYTVTDLNASMLMGSGDNSASMITLEGASCGGGGKVDVYSFTADAEGSYTVTVTGTAAAVDPVVFARSYCGYSAPRFELACNDDIDGMGGNVNSSVTLTLTAAQTVYLFVDSYNGTSTGAYTIAVTAN